MIDYLEKHPYLSLSITCLLLYFFNLGELPASIMEARNFNVAREMSTQGNWLKTTMNGIARYQKPPLPPWLTVPFIKITALDFVQVYRISTSIIAGTGVLLMYKVVKLLTHHKQIALYTALILATSYYYLVIRFEAPSDTYTHVMMLAAVLFCIHCFKRIHTTSHFWLAGLFFGLSVLAKGPVSPYAVFIPFAIAYVIVYAQNKKQILLRLLGVVFIGITIGGSWYLYIRLADPETMQAIAEKETGNWTSYNVRPFYYYWSFFIQSGLWTIPAFTSLFYPYFKNKIAEKKLYLFSWIWTIAGVILLSVIPEKKSRYLVPVLIPLAINTALIIQYLIYIQTSYNRLKWLLRFHHYLILTITLSLLAIPFFISSDSSNFWIWYGSLATSVLLLFTYSIYQQFKKNYKIFFWTSIGLMLIVTSIGMTGLPFLKSNKDYHPLQTLDEKRFSKPAFYYKNIAPEIIWDFGKITKKWASTLQKPDQLIVLVERNRVKRFKNEIADEYKIISKEKFDRNYFRSAPKKRNRYVTFVFELKKTNP